MERKVQIEIMDKMYWTNNNNKAEFWTEKYGTEKYGAKSMDRTVDQKVWTEKYGAEFFAKKNGTDHEPGRNDVWSDELGGINKMNTILIGSGISGRQVLSQLPWYSNLEFPIQATSSKFTQNHTQEASLATSSSDYMSFNWKKPVLDRKS